MAFSFRNFKMIKSKAFPFFFILCRTWPSQTRVLGRGEFGGNQTTSDVYPASHGVEVRTRDEDAGDPGWTDDATADVKGDLPASGGASLVVGESQVRTIDVLVVVDKTDASGGIATNDDGSTHG
jgi:hypothetical protein